MINLFKLWYTENCRPNPNKIFWKLTLWLINLGPKRNIVFLHTSSYPYINFLTSSCLKMCWRSYFTKSYAFWISRSSTYAETLLPSTTIRHWTTFNFRESCVIQFELRETKIRSLREISPRWKNWISCAHNV